MLEEAGHNMALYDLYYHPDTCVLEKQYDFMTATEVIEHLYHPDMVWKQWLNLVKPGGWISTDDENGHRCRSLSDMAL